MDPQADALYKAEHEFCGRRRRVWPFRQRLTLKAAREIVKQVRALYNLKPVRVETTRLVKRTPQAWAQDITIDDEYARTVITFNLTAGPANLQNLLHELAHVVASHYFEKAEPHGREFVGILSWLYDYYKIIPEDAFGVILRRHKVKRRNTTSCSPEALKNRQ